jgi:2-polyprenyl-3-methyl-5-hydroxy-6-metoxy-1,4-benzoquinol methylase
MDKERSQRFMQKVVGDVGTAMAAALVLVGDQAGLFRAMAGAGPVSAQDLATRAGIHARYAQEWLSAMACAGYVEFDAQSERFELPAEHAQFLCAPSEETYLGGLFSGLPSLMGTATRLVQAFSRGEGISFAEFGEAMPLALEQMNRPVYEKRLTSMWLPAMPEVVQRLQAGGRAIDVGCGTGIVPIALAKAYPSAQIEALDLDARSITIARGYAEQAGVSDRIRFIQASADVLPQTSTYDLVTTFDVVHDLPDPLGVLQKIRACLREGGSYLMVEPKVDDRLEANLANPFAKMLYGISCMHCVPQSLSQGGSGLGACWGPGRARVLALDAGFSRFDVLPIRSPALAFYQLRP